MGSRFSRCSTALLTVLVLAACGPARPGGDRAFVSETATATVAVIDLDQGRVMKRLEVGLLPHNLVLSPDARTLYVSLAGSQAVAVIDTRRAELLGTWLTAPVPGLRADGGVIQPHLDRGAFTHTTCYDCHRDGDARPRYVGGRPVGLRLSADGQRLAVAHLTTAEVAVLDTATGLRVASAVLPPRGEVREPASLDFLGDELLVTMRATQPTQLPGLVRRLDARTLAFRGEQPSGANPVEVRTLPGRGQAAVTRFDADQVSLLDAAGGEAMVTVANGPLGLTPLSGDRLLVLGYYSNSVSVVDLATGLADTWPLTLDGAPLVNPTHAAVGTDPDLAWVVQSGTDGHLLALDLRTRAVLRALPINGLSYDVAVVPGPLLTP
jgi:DNA-binding beta-propeller fold protein YncE